jgi:valyl-tRNA synthetase
MENNYSTEQTIEHLILLCPPNVTGVLHMGHMLNNTIQDVLIRTSKRLQCLLGSQYGSCSIATEAKVVAKLKAEGINKTTISKSFWLMPGTGQINMEGLYLSNLKLGASCDWERTKFTMDPDMSASVIRSL